MTVIISTPHRPAPSSPCRSGAGLRFIACAGVASAAVLLIAPDPAAAATDYPVCLRVYGAPTYDECYYTTMEACRLSASGRSAQCFINPFYQGAGARPATPHRPLR